MKRLYANLSLEHDALKDVDRKKALKPVEKHPMVEYLINEHELSELAAWRVMAISHTSFSYSPDLTMDIPVIDALI